MYSVQKERKLKAGALSYAYISVKNGDSALQQLGKALYLCKNTAIEEISYDDGEFLSIERGRSTSRRIFLTVSRRKNEC